MNFNDVLSEISTPTGHIFMRFGAKDTGQKDEYGNPKQYLVGWAGFGNNPEQVQYGNARVKFNKLTSASDVVDAVREVLGDTQFGKVFISAKTLIIVPPKKIPDDAAFLGKFFDWVRREGGDRISLYQKDDPTEAPPEKPDEKVTVKRKRKPNPMFGKKIRDVQQAAPQKTVTFTVGPRFYKQAQRDLPNLMKYRGPGGTFIMPNELFMQFRAQAEKTYPYAEIKVQNRAVTAEDLNEGGDHDPRSRGVADGYYGRRADPHKYVKDEEGKNQRVKLTDPDEINDYMAGYKDDSFGSKVYESNDPIDKDARDSHGSRAPGVKKLKDGKYHAVNADGEHKIFASKEQAERHAKKRKTNEGIADTLGTLGGAGLGYYMGGGGPGNLLGIMPVAGALGGGYLGHHTGKILGNTFSKDKDVDETVSGMGHGSKEEMLSHVEQTVEAMQLALERELEWHLTDFYGTKVVAQLMHPATVALENIKQFVAQQLTQAGEGEVAEDGSPTPPPPAPTPPPPAPTPPPPAPTTSGTSLPSADPMVKNLPAINATGDGNNARTDKLASMVGGQSVKAAAPTTADKQMATTFETRIVDIDDDDFWLFEAGKASRAFCKANARKRENMGASQLSSCISQGYLPHKSGKSVKVADRRIKLNGVKMKGEKYGGPKSTKAGE